MKRKVLLFTILLFFVFKNLNAQQTIFTTHSHGNPPNKTKLKYVPCSSYIDKYFCEQVGGEYGVIYELEGTNSNAVEKKYCVFGVRSSDNIDVIYYRIGLDAGSKIPNPVNIQYSYNVKTHRISEIITNKSYNPIEKDASPNRYYDCLSDEDIGMAIMKLTLSRPIFNAIYTNSKIYNWIDYAKTKQNFKQNNLYNF